MPIPAAEREKMLAVRLCGPRVIARLESIEITKLRDLADRDPLQLVHEVNIAAGRPIWHPPIATQAITNLITAARQDLHARTSSDIPSGRTAKPAPCCHIDAGIERSAISAPAQRGKGDPASGSSLLEIRRHAGNWLERHQTSPTFGSRLLAEPVARSTDCQ